MRGRIAVLAVAIGFLAAPALASVALDSCSPCCARAGHDPCDAADARCASLASSGCCDAAPAGPASQAKRLSDPPKRACAAPAALAAPVPERVLVRQVAGAPALLTSPLRLSVVLLI